MSKMQPHLPERFDVLLIKDSEVGAWVAHALEVDVAGQGESIPEALGKLQYAMAAAAIQMASGESDKMRISKAPQEYWDQYSEGFRVEVDAPREPVVRASVPVTVPSFHEARVS